MKRQDVHLKQHLAVVAIDLSKVDLVENVVALPNNAGVVQVNLEVLETADAGISADVGFSGATDRFMNDVDLASITQHNSSICHKCNRVDMVLITLSAKPTKGKIKMRVGYFLPSVVETEF